MSKRSNVPNGTADKKSDEVVDKQTHLLTTQDPGHFSLVRAYHLADLITLMNGFCGVNSIISSLRYCLNPDPASNRAAIYAALAFIPLGLFFDFFDGKVARWRNKSSMMGAELDSLADLISFGVSPAVAAFAIGLRTPIDQFLLTLFVLAGLARLARFNVTAGSIPHDASGKAKYFEGLPIPTSLSIVSLMAYWVRSGSVLDHIPGGVIAEGTIFAFHPICALFIAHGCCMISRTLHVPKP
ncbi:CDP-diacylglycerol-serine O-phosphatidyltransferase [Polychaeton citri CBS 116435]|uniref:CDP-diacylglycerol--serine O-phosphatidyltransferase n=1 Tax=Polychaeton citri CBS 116435 TaxID=1314669 RepID=A0A9P4UL24_9PEZI|nr:CDP-diacylglycerol-serine O-phosphatidyltransferase [Polychaeton citri CBS 116435]